MIFEEGTRSAYRGVGGMEEGCEVVKEFFSAPKTPRFAVILQKMQMNMHMCYCV